MPTLTPTFKIVDSGSLTGDQNMTIDRDALSNAIDGNLDQPVLRFFQWTKPTVTYGYLLELKRVEEWAKTMVHKRSTINYAKRPTGGGVVLHSETDLSFSVLWNRASKLFSDSPRACYEEIHSLVIKALTPHFGNSLTLKQKDMAAPACEQPQERFSACFQQPVCNDVMMRDQKLVGGALRITKTAILYQGTIQLGVLFPVEQLKNQIAENFNHGL